MFFFGSIAKAWLATVPWSQNYPIVLSFAQEYRRQSRLCGDIVLSILGGHRPWWPSRQGGALNCQALDGEDAILTSTVAYSV
jgi:hypothetical protein